MPWRSRACPGPRSGGNQGTLFGDVRLFVEDAETTPADTHTTTDGDHGRIETRRHSVITDIDWLKARHHWPGLAAIGKVVRTRESRTKTSTETTEPLRVCRRLFGLSHATIASSLDCA